MSSAQPLPTPEPVAPGPRAGTAVALVLLAAVLVIAGRSETTDAGPRTGRRVELVELIRVEQVRAVELERRVANLSKQVSEHELRSTADAARLAVLQRRIDKLAAPAGMTPVTGPGLEVTLSDSALAVSPSGNINDLVIHEQDLQAVINALWAGGAEALSVNGQRVLATTAIRCVGNTLLLHGAVYSPPYVMRAIGDSRELTASLDNDPSVATLTAAARQYGLGFAIRDVGNLTLPAYEGGSTVKVARPAPTIRG